MLSNAPLCDSRYSPGNYPSDKSPASPNGGICIWMGYVCRRMTTLTTALKEELFGTVRLHLRFVTRPQPGGDLCPRGMGGIRGGVPAGGLGSSQWTIPCQQ